MMHFNIIADVQKEIYTWRININHDDTTIVPQA